MYLNERWRMCLTRLASNGVLPSGNTQIGLAASRGNRLSRQAELTGNERLWVAIVAGGF